MQAVPGAILMCAAVVTTPARAPAVEPGAGSRATVLFQHRQTVQVAPDGNYRTGGFCRVHRLRSEDRFLVTFGTGDYGPPEKRPAGESHLQGQVYKEYTDDFRFTGRHGYFFHGGGDSACVMVGDIYYLLTGGPPGQRLIKYDARTWRELGRAGLTLDRAREESNDQMLAFVDGRLDASSLYRVWDAPPDPRRGEGTWHQLFTPDLEFVEKRILTQPPHGNGSSMAFVGGVYHLLTSTAFFGDLQVIRLDRDWRVIDTRTLVERAQWSQGVVHDPGQGRFYVTYLDTRSPGCPNACLAAFDRDWRPLGSTAVTSFQPGERKAVGRPSVMRHGALLYVSYDVDTLDARGETDFDWRAFVAVYEPTVATPSDPPSKSPGAERQSGR